MAIEDPHARDGAIATLRQLDQEGARAVLVADEAVLRNLYADDHLLHFAPAGVVRTRQQVLSDVSAQGAIYSSFSRVTEHVSIHGDVAVTIGSERAVPLENHPGHAATGRELSRRYTHVWRREGYRWKLLVRHVNVT